MSKTIAIIGASTDRRKYGNKAVRAFRDGGWTVYPVNAKATEVPGPIDRVSMYVPPAVGATMLEAIAARRPDELYFNPGSEDAAVLAKAIALGLHPINACSIVNIGRRPDMYPDE